VGISLLVFLPIAAPFTAKRATGQCLKSWVQSKIPKSVDRLQSLKESGVSLRKIAEQERLSLSAVVRALKPAAEAPRVVRVRFLPF
jgi:hypothetical protein